MKIKTKDGVKTLKIGNFEIVYWSCISKKFYFTSTIEPSNAGAMARWFGRGLSVKYLNRRVY